MPSDLAAPRRVARRTASLQQLARLLPAALPLMLLAALAAFEPRVLSAGNLLNIAQQASYLSIFALAQTLVLLVRGCDLSLGACVSAVSVLSALVLTGVGSWSGIAAGLALGACVGLFNAVSVTMLRVGPFVATIGSLNVCLGIATTISDGRPVVGFSPAFLRLLYSGSVGGVPAPVAIAVALVVTGHLVLRGTVFGRSLVLAGSNPRAAAAAGLSVGRTTACAYILCSLLAALGALMLTARTGSGEPNLGGNLALESIAAAVVGGVSLRGGTGGVPEAVLGALFITVLSNGMNLVRVGGYMQMIVLGCVIIAALILERLRKR